MDTHNVDPIDERLAQVENDKNNELKNVVNTYNGMIDQTSEIYKQQQNMVKEWGETQSKLQQENTDFALEQIEQQKEQAQKDYQKEQSAAYSDYQKQINQYGANAEQMVSSGMGKTGYSESSRVNMYNSHQNRVALARETVNEAMRGFDNTMKEARLQNNSALAEIAFNTLQQSVSLALQGLQYENQLRLDELDRKTAIDNTYYNRHLDVLNQINSEKALAEQIRQYNLSLQEEQRQFDEKMKLDALIQESYPTISRDDDSSGDGLFGEIFEQEPEDELVVDMSSVISLGYGPISAQKLNELVEQGLVEEYIEDGLLKYRKIQNLSAKEKNEMYGEFVNSQIGKLLK